MILWRKNQNSFLFKGKRYVFVPVEKDSIRSCENCVASDSTRLCYLINYCTSTKRKDKRGGYFKLKVNGREINNKRQ